MGQHRRSARSPLRVHRTGNPLRLGPALLGAWMCLGVLLLVLSPTFQGPSHPFEGRSNVAFGGPLTVAVHEAPSGGFVAEIEANPPSGVAPLQVTFTGSAEGGVPPYTYAWTFGDGTTGSGETVHHNFTSTGTLDIGLVVTDSTGNEAVASTTVSVSTPTTPGISSSLLLVVLLGGAAAAIVGVAMARWYSGSRPAEVDDSGAPEPNVILAQWHQRHVLTAGATRLPAPPAGPPVNWAGPPTYPPAAQYTTYQGVPPPTSRPPPWTGPSPRPLPSPDAPTWSPRPIAPPVPGPTVTPAPEHLAPSARSAAATPNPPPTASPAPAPAPPGLALLLALNVEETVPLVDRLLQLNALPWRQIDQEASAASVSVLAQSVAKLDPLVREVRGVCLDPVRTRSLMRDLLQDWFHRGPTPSVPSGGARATRGLLSSSEGSESTTLVERMGKATGTLVWRAILRMSPLLVMIFALFVFVEVSAFFVLDHAYAGAPITPTIALIVPAAVLGPPAAILALYPVGEWGHLLWTRVRHHDADLRLYALPQVRLVSYTLVLGLAETSRVAADFVSTSLFGTPSSLVNAGNVSLVGVAGFLLIISLTIFFGWSAVSAWNAGGSRKATVCASVLYLAVFAIWAATEGRLLIYLARSPTLTSVQSAQALLLDVPLYLLVAGCFVLGLFVAFSEPEWQRSVQRTGHLREKVAQAVLDDLTDQSPASTAVPMDRLSDLASGERTAAVAKVLRELFTYDMERDRLLVLRCHDPGTDTVLALVRRSDSGGSYYQLTKETISTAPAGGASAGGAGASGATTGDALWSRGDLLTPTAWLDLLRQRKGQPRISRPPSEARDGPGYRALLQLLTDPEGTEARSLFHKEGWTKPSGPMLLVQLLDQAAQGDVLVPDIETDGEYLEVELSRVVGRPTDGAPFLGPWEFSGWRVTREIVPSSGGSSVQYRAVRLSPPPG